MDSAATEATVVSLVNFSGDLELGAGDDSIESVSFAVGEQTKTISVNAFEGDNDFDTAEEVEITAEVTQGVTELVVQPLSVTVSETVPVIQSDSVQSGSFGIGHRYGSLRSTAGQCVGVYEPERDVSILDHIRFLCRRCG